jgi:hypothetical protein
MNRFDHRQAHPMARQSTATDDSCCDDCSTRRDTFGPLIAGVQKLFVHAMSYHHPGLFLRLPLRLIGVPFAGRVGLGAGGFGGCFGGFCVMSICNQKLVYERLRANRSEIIEAHKSMGDRASVIVGGGTAIATCFGIGDKLAQTNLTCLILVGVATLIAMTAATMVWVPTSTLLPGVSDEDDLWQSFIDVDEETAAANLIRDEANAFDAEVAANARRAVAFRVMTIAVWFQLIFVFIAVWLGK